MEIWQRRSRRIPSSRLTTPPGDPTRDDTGRRSVFCAPRHHQHRRQSAGETKQPKTDRDLQIIEATGWRAPITISKVWLHRKDTDADSRHRRGWKCSTGRLSSTQAGREWADLIADNRPRFHLLTRPSGRRSATWTAARFRLK